MLDCALVSTASSIPNTANDTQNDHEGKSWLPTVDGVKSVFGRGRRGMPGTAVDYNNLLMLAGLPDSVCIASIKGPTSSRISKVGGGIIEVGENAESTWRCEEN